MAPTPDEPAQWRELVVGVLADPERLSLVFQPIVGLADARVVGYEALSRFDGPPGLTPDRWFAAADRLGVGADLEAVAVRKALDVRADLPANCFLTVNVSPHLVTEPALRDLLLGSGSLAPLVIELTEHRDVDDPAPLVRLRDEVADRGGLLALDDAGSGWSGLQQITRLRPHLIKLDRALVQDADTDEVRLALAEVLGEFAGRIDAWLLAEGVETWGELEAFLRLGVPLAQGYLLGRPAPGWTQLDPAAAARLRAAGSRVRLRENVASLVEEVWLDGVDGPRTDQVGVRLDAWGRPDRLLLPSRRSARSRAVAPAQTGARTRGALDEDRATHRLAPVTLRVPPSASVHEVARRLVTRGEPERFDPVVCVDETGRPLGVVRVERILLRLAELQPPG
ncbi:EAL domain-containing protein [Thalassiella azotivora]